MDLKSLLSARGLVGARSVVSLLNRAVGDAGVESTESGSTVDVCPCCVVESSSQSSKSSGGSSSKSSGGSSSRSSSSASSSSSSSQPCAEVTCCACLSGDVEDKNKYVEVTEWYSYITFVINILTDGVYCANGYDRTLSDIAPVKWDDFGPKDGLVSKEVYVWDNSLAGKSFKAGDEVVVSGKIFMLYDKEVSERPWYRISVGGGGCGCVESSSSSKSDSSHSHPIVPSSGSQSGSSSPECAEFDIAEELPCFTIPSACVCDSVRGIDLADYLPDYDFHVVATKVGVYCEPIPIELTYTILSKGYYTHEISVEVHTPIVMRDDHATYVYEGDFVAAGELLYVPFVYIYIKYDSTNPIMCEAPLNTCELYPSMLMCLGSKRPEESSYSYSESSSSESSSSESSSSSDPLDCAEFDLLPYCFNYGTSYDFSIDERCYANYKSGKYTVLDQVIGFVAKEDGIMCSTQIVDNLKVDVYCADPSTACTTIVTPLGWYVGESKMPYGTSDYKSIPVGGKIMKGDMFGFRVTSTMTLTKECTSGVQTGVLRPGAVVSISLT